MPATRMPWQTKVGSNLCRTARMKWRSKTHETMPQKRARRNSKQARRDRQQLEA